MKRNLLKAISIAFIIFLVLTWIIPTGTYSSGTFAKGSINALGIFDLFKIPLTSIIQFASYGVIFIVIGGFYAIMKKTEAYDIIVSGVTNKFKGKEQLFVILTTINFALLASLTGLTIPLFILVPLFASFLIKMNYSKVVMLMSTVGAILTGCIGSIIGVNTGFNYYSGIYLNQLFNTNVLSQLLPKIIIFILLTAALIFVILKQVQKDNKRKAARANAVKKETVKAPITKKASVKKTATKKSNTKKSVRKSNVKRATTKAAAVTKSVKKVSTSRTSALPLTIIFILVMILAVLSMYNWNSVFGLKIFNNLNDTVTGVSIGSFPILKYLFSGTSALGMWTNYDLAVILVMASVLIAWIYKFSLNDFVETFIAGVKKWIPTAMYVVLASVIMCAMYEMLYYGKGTISETITNFVLSATGGFNVITTSISTLLGGFFYNDIYYFISSTYVPLAAFSANVYPIAAIVIQSMFALAMLLVPTSMILIAGLSYFDVSYKSWIKNIWKFALAAFIIITITCCILTLFV